MLFTLLEPLEFKSISKFAYKTSGRVLLYKSKARGKLEKNLFAETFLFVSCQYFVMFPNVCKLGNILMKKHLLAQLCILLKLAQILKHCSHIDC